MFVCCYRASLGLISTLIITIKKEKEKYFGAKSCIEVGQGKITILRNPCFTKALSDGRSFPYRRHFLQIEHETETVVHVCHFVRRNCADPLRQE